ncbi:MAG: PhzF family phenazine biosynthesis protein [Firmicutes bacterium]|nr:PhzF family phenazine biosynthesis protein [Bacillota bacterium]
MAILLMQVDAFTDKLFTGNPAAVCIMDKPAEEDWMQKVATEMNLSETAFLHRQGEEFVLRWFTPVTEVDLCGHATLAAAHALWECGFVLPDKEISFITKSGVLKAKKKEKLIEMDFPAELASPVPAPPELLGALEIRPKYTGKTGTGDYLVEVESEEVLRDLKPDFAKLAVLPARGVCVTSRASANGFDFVSRFFAPRLGINEDPVTGSAHSFLGPYWGVHLEKDDFLAYQASARGGILRVRLCGNRVYIGGEAVTVFKGEFTGGLACSQE